MLFCVCFTFSSLCNTAISYNVNIHHWMRLNKRQKCFYEEAGPVFCARAAQLATLQKALNGDGVKFDSEDLELKETPELIVTYDVENCPLQGRGRGGSPAKRHAKIAIHRITSSNAFSIWMTFSGWSSDSPFTTNTSSARSPRVTILAVRRLMP